MRLQRFHAALPVLLLVFGMLAASCGSGGSDSDESQDPASWTYMVYISADNNLSLYAKADINEMEEVGSTGDVNIVVQAEFNADTTPGVPATAMRGRVAKDFDQGNLGGWYTEIGDRDMNDPAVLTEFISWAAQAYPADRYALVLWSHGQGWKDVAAEGLPAKGMIMDNGSDVRPVVMPTHDIAQAILSSGVDIEVLNLDTCLMGMYEVAYELRDAASHLVFSEEEYPTNGDPYDAVLQALVDDPFQDGRDLARTIAEKCIEFYEGIHIVTATKSAVDLTEISQLHAGVRALAQHLIAHMDAEKPNIESARSLSVAYYYPENHDLGDFLQKLSDATEDQALKDMIPGIQAALSAAVIANGVYWYPGDTEHQGITGSRGLAIYLPETLTSDLVRYASLACNQPDTDVTWSDLVYAFLVEP